MTTHEKTMALPESVRYAQVVATFPFADGVATVEGCYSPYHALRTALERHGFKVTGVIRIAGEPREYYRAAEYVETFHNLLRTRKAPAFWTRVCRANGLDVSLSRKARTT